MTNFHQQMSLAHVVAIDGQLFYVAAPNQAFLAQRPFIQAQLQGHPMQATQNHAQLQQSQLQQPHHQQQHQQQIQHQLNQLPPSQAPEPGANLRLDNDLEFPQLESEQQAIQIRHTPLAEKTNERLKTKVKNIKGANYIGHYIDSQLIIETQEPLREKKKKRKRKLLAQNQNFANLQSVNIAQQQQQVAQHSHQRDLPQPQVSLAISSPPPDHEATPNNHQDSAQPEAVIDAIDSDILRLREEMKTWSVADVVNFIETQDAISSYSTKFAEDEIDGTALLYMIDRNLNIQALSTMFKYGPAMKIEATLSKYKLRE